MSASNNTATTNQTSFLAVKIYPEVENLPMGLRTRRPGRSQADTIRDLQKELGISNEWDNPAS